MAKSVAAALLCLALAFPALATPGPRESAPSGAEGWSFPPPDPRSWWDDERPKPPDAADPLGDRRLNRGERAIPIDNGVEATTYRLWGLPPLQTQVLRGGEMIIEAWVRPSGSVRQTVIRIVVRRDGRAFVQARAGLACCEPGIARRVGFDAETDAQPFRGLRDLPVWGAPRGVRVDEGGGVAETVCVDGVSYDVTLVAAGRSLSLRRACDDAEIGQIADVLEPALRAALGREPRIDVLFPRGSDFSVSRKAYADLIAGGGALKPDPDARPQPPGVAPAEP